MANIGPMPAIDNWGHGNESVPYGLSNLATTTSTCLLLHHLVVSVLHLLPLPFQLICWFFAVRQDPDFDR